MTFAKPTPKNQESTFDEIQRLMCSVPGCPNRWTIKIDKPMCSGHQWGKFPKDLSEQLKPKEPQWYDAEKF